MQPQQLHSATATRRSRPCKGGTEGQWLDSSVTRGRQPSGTSMRRTDPASGLADPASELVIPASGRRILADRRNGGGGGSLPVDGLGGPIDGLDGPVHGLCIFLVILFD